VYYCIWCSALLVLAVVLSNCVVSRVLCVHTAHDAAPQPQPTQPGRTPHAVGHGFILLMMGIMMPDTCWDRSLLINIELVASCWFSLHLIYFVNFSTFLSEGMRMSYLDESCVGSNTYLLTYSMVQSPS